MTDSANSVLSNDQGGQGSGNGAASAPWYGDVISKETDGDFQAFVKNKNYPSPLEAIKGHYSAEKMLGHDRAGRTLVMPKDENDAEGMKAFRAKLGVPETADGYKLPFKDGSSDVLVKEAAKWFHAAGVPPKQAEAITTAWNAFIEKQLTDGEAAAKAENARQLDQLKADLGNKYDTHVELGRRALRVFGKDAGFSDDDIKAVEDIVGTAKTVRLFMKMGEGLRESQFAGGDATMGMTPDAIRTKIKEIQTNRTANKYGEKEWKETYLPQVMKLQEALDKA